MFLNFVLNKVILIHCYLNELGLFFLSLYALLFLHRPCFYGKTEAKSNLRFICRDKKKKKKRALRLEKLALRRVEAVPLHVEKK